MALYLYEQSIVNKLKQITGDERIIITPSDNIINVIPRITNDELELPLLHLIRTDWKLNTNHQHGLAMNGVVNNNMYMFESYDSIGEDGKVHRIHAIPMSFAHTLEVWTKTREENDDIVRELIWFFTTMNQFTIKVPYDTNSEFDFHVQLSTDIIDNTNILTQKDIGEIYLQAISFRCDEAYLWKSSTHNPTTINVSLDEKFIDMYERK